MAVLSAQKEKEKLHSIKQGLKCLRSSKRRTVVWPATFYVGEFEFRATMYDISLGGIRLKLPLPLANGTEASVRIKNQVKLEGRVVWYAGEFIGLKFIDSAEDVRKSLGDLATGLE